MFPSLWQTDTIHAQFTAFLSRIYMSMEWTLPTETTPRENGSV